MRESVGKAVARELFYRGCLPRWLSREQLRSGDCLVLLGDEPRELPLIDALGVPRDRVHSVERQWPVYHKQLDQRLGVSLYLGEMNEYLEYVLHRNQGFQVLNLDVEGSYRTQLDPAMTSVLLFAWRNPETVVATYSTIGRDSESLWEGIKSFLLLLWLAPEAVTTLLSKLDAYYREMGFETPWYMVLRDLFWVRSHLEHAACASAMVRCTSVPKVQRLFDLGDLLWNELVKRRPVPLRLSLLGTVVSELQKRPAFQKIAHEATPDIGLEIADMRHVVYRSSAWSHRCYFTKFRVAQAPVSCERWIEAVCEQLVGHYTYINREGQASDLPEPNTTTPLRLRGSLWRRSDIYRFAPRRLIIPAVSPAIAGLNQSVLAIQTRR